MAQTVAVAETNLSLPTTTIPKTGTATATASNPRYRMRDKIHAATRSRSTGCHGGEIQALRMTTNITVSDWIPWLQRFGEQLQQNPETHAEIAKRLVQLGQLHRGELGKVAERIGRQILAQIPPAVLRKGMDEEIRRKMRQRNGIREGMSNVTGGNFTAAIALYNEAIRLKPDFPYAYNERGVAQDNLGQYEDAIASFNEAIRLKPDFPDAYNNRGKAQCNLGQYEDAIASFDSGLTLKRDDWQAWGNRGIAAGTVQTRNSPYLPSAFAIQNPDLNVRGFEGELASYQEGLKYCPKDTHPEGWGMLNFRIGNTYYGRSRQNPKTRHQDQANRTQPLQPRPGNPHGNCLS